MVPRPLGLSGLEVTPIGFGAFKIGRNLGARYPSGYDLPDEDEATRLVRAVLDLGVNYIDTAPAYGVSEERIGRFAGNLPCVISTKVGEAFENGRSTFDFSRAAVTASIERSRKRLAREVLDLVFVHSDGRDLDVIEHTDAVPALVDLREGGSVRAIGFSGKTVEGARRALDWADAIMVEYHLGDRSHEGVIADAAGRGVGVVVKKGLASGRLDAAGSIRFVLSNPHVTSMVIGGLSADHMRANIGVAETVRP
jgi:aryl-alcohol dehydrogenase-like predicted oxidoreductase